MFGRAITFGVPAGSVSGLSAASPAPSATNPLVTKDGQFSDPARLTAAPPFLLVAAGATTQVLAAPPSGYSWLINNVTTINQSTTLTAGMQIIDTATGGVVLGTTATGIAALVAGTSAGTFLSFNNRLMPGAVSVKATGAGDIVFACSATLVSTAIAVPWFYAVTSTLVAVPSLIPAAGFATIPAGAGWNVPSLAQWSHNADSAATITVIEITRGSVVLTQTSASVASGASGATNHRIPELINGDVIKFKCVVAPVSAGAVLVGGAYYTVHAV